MRAIHLKPDNTFAWPNFDVIFHICSDSAVRSKLWPFSDAMTVVNAPEDCRSATCARSNQQLLLVEIGKALYNILHSNRLTCSHGVNLLHKHRNRCAHKQAHKSSLRTALSWNRRASVQKYIHANTHVQKGQTQIYADTQRRRTYTTVSLSFTKTHTNISDRVHPVIPSLRLWSCFSISALLAWWRSKQQWNITCAWVIKTVISMANWG